MLTGMHHSFERTTLALAVSLALGGCGGRTHDSPSNDAGVAGGGGSSGGSGSGGYVASGGAGGALDAGGLGGMTGDCCSGHPWPGCGDPAVAQCVCAQDPYCCQSQWDAPCASEVVQLGCGACGPGGSGGSGAGGAGGTGLGGSGGTGLGGFGGTGLGGSGGAGGAGTCNPALCPAWNAPTCCLSPTGPCGIKPNDNVCTEYQCLKPPTPCRACLCTSCSAGA